jgi:hypothetical protein
MISIQTSVIYTFIVWYSHARAWFLHAECNLYTQSVTLTPRSMIPICTSTISSHTCDFDKYECVYDTHECYFNTLRVTLSVVWNLFLVHFCLFHILTQFQRLSSSDSSTFTRIIFRYIAVLILWTWRSVMIRWTWIWSRYMNERQPIVWC